MNNFWLKNKVFLLGLLSAISVALAEFNAPGETSGKALLFAVVIAALSFVANSWRGQGPTILGIIGTSAGVAVDMLSGNTFTWYKFAIAVVIAVLASVAPPPKPVQMEGDRRM